MIVPVDERGCWTGVLYGSVEIQLFGEEFGIIRPWDREGCDSDDKFDGSRAGFS